MKKVFVDSDIILDLVLDRPPHNDSARKLFNLIGNKEIEGCSTPVIFANIFYVLRKRMPGKEAMDVLRRFRLMMKVLPMDEKTVDGALSSGFHDFEDALQSQAAIGGNIPVFITRNIRDHKKSKLVVCTAEEYLGMWSKNG
jgi:predicted nucleic acid-binding protein